MRAVRRQTFDRDDTVARLEIADADRTGASHLIVDVNRARAALGDAAAEFSTGQPRVVAQGPQKWSIGLDLQVARCAVDVERNHVSSLPRPGPLQAPGPVGSGRELAMK